MTEADLQVSATVIRTPAAVAGLIFLTVGLLAVLGATLLFVLGYPDAWYALDRSIEESQEFIRMLMGTWSVGLIFMLLGASLYFYGRRITSTGEVTGVRIGGVE